MSSAISPSSISCTHNPRVQGSGFRVPGVEQIQHIARRLHPQDCRLCQAQLRRRPCPVRTTLGFRFQGSGSRVQGSGFRVQGSGFRVQGSGFRVPGVEQILHNQESQGQILALTSTISRVKVSEPLAGTCQEKTRRRPHPVSPTPQPRPLHTRLQTSIPNPETFGYWWLAVVKHPCTEWISLVGWIDR